MELCICDWYADAVPNDAYLSNDCGSAYGHVGRYKEAEQTLLLALKKKEGATMLHFTLAAIYLHLGRRSDAQTQYEQGIEVQKQPFLKEFLTGFMLSELYPSDRTRLLEAKTHYERSLHLQPQFFEARQQLDQLNRQLGQTGGFVD